MMEVVENVFTLSVRVLTQAAEFFVIDDIIVYFLLSAIMFCLCIIILLLLVSVTYVIHT